MEVLKPFLSFVSPKWSFKDTLLYILYSFPVCGKFQKCSSSAVA